MSLLVVGSVALDSVKTPFGEVSEVLGGAATYFSVAASYFTRVQMVGAVGKDFPEQHLQLLRDKNVDIAGLQVRSGKTFRWKGEYGYQLNEARTLETHLNVFEDFRPELPESFRTPDILFLANIDPELQLQVLRQVKRPHLVACDTMNFWIEGKREALIEMLREVDAVIINDGEARELAKEANLIKAAQKILDLGPRILVIKRGENGVLMFNERTVFAAPAYPLETLFDPTGAGDTFAGGCLGFLSRCYGKNASVMGISDLRQAVIIGSVMASFNVESFSLDRLRKLTWPEIEGRYKEFQKLTAFEDLL